MRHLKKVIVLAGMFLSLAGTATAENRPQPIAPGLDMVTEARQTYIFTLSGDTSPGAVGRIAREAAGIGRGQLRHTYRTVLKGFSLKVSDADLVRIQEEIPEIVGVYRNNIYSVAKKPPDSPGKGPGGGGDTGDSQVVPLGVERMVGSNLENVNIQGCGDNGELCPTAWVLDTGIDGNNPDLNVDGGRSVNCVQGSRQRAKKTWKDEHGHGTHVAGTIAAIDNNIDVVGVAAGAQVVSVRVLDRRGLGYTSEILCGLEYVATKAQPGDVVNMSLGGPANTIIDDAVKAAANLGIWFSLAAGNDEIPAGYQSPARVSHPNVYTVSAVDSNDYFAGFSNYGNPPIDRAAPGVSVLSLKLGGGTTIKSGTSMAAPHVAGLVLLGNVGCDGTAIGDSEGLGEADIIAHLQDRSSPCPSPDPSPGS